MDSLTFSNTWFRDGAKNIWNNIIPIYSPKKILEIGSYEGQATCYLIEHLGNLQTIEITCIDTWEGGFEHKEHGTDMSAVEKRFHDNIQFAASSVLNFPFVEIRKGTSEIELMKLFLEGRQNYYDFIYIDGSHETVDVLSDAVLSFKLLAPEGLMIFDDYCWASGVKNLDYFPKMAIDAFTTIHANKIEMIPTYNTQIAIVKT